ncbi:MAG: Re/Si-specific NAD(P)(+) transhydrogenase subunit alpha [Chloroflexi bacterium]|nr:MAG: Re/Si-specific NAD(P)(+) transhydrogenase subunit alpha [Chloroflexota bacterium]
MKVLVVRETMPGERRVAATPETVAKMVAAGLEVTVEAGAGEEASFPDAAFEAAGAKVVREHAKALAAADIVLRVQPPADGDVKAMRKGALSIGFLQPATSAAAVKALAKHGVTAFSLEMVPRISRAQSMDALSSQASLAGYKAVLMAAVRLGKYFPMLMSAAGTIAPARVLVLGAGVAGLQAIATARRLGAVVEAYDVRPAVRDEVKSLGATFLELNLEAQEGQGGYAREQSDEFLAKQRELLTERVAAADVVITTAAVPGRKAPVLVTAEMVKGMRPGSVIVDLAADGGGNVELTKAGEVVEVGGVTIDGTRNVPSTIPVHASQLYARNVANLLLLMIKDGQLNLDLEDDVIKGAVVTHGGEVVNENARKMMAP